MVFCTSLNVPYSAGLCYSTMEGKQATSPSVIVIGSGMAGIAAARTLFDASFQVRATIYFLYAKFQQNIVNF